MIKPILNSLTKTFGEQKLTFYEMSALANLEWRQYVADHPLPPPDDQLAFERAILDIYSQAIAFSLLPGFPDTTVEALQAQVRTGCNPEALAQMHAAVAEVCGWETPDSDVSQDEMGDADPQEEADPKP